jgi:molybdopterin synthase sulfur carrier subunit
MTVKVLYFASLKEHIGRGEDRVEELPGDTVARVWERATGGRPRPSNTLAAINMEYVGLDHPVSAGDEVAFFPPVTGGAGWR